MLTTIKLIFVLLQLIVYGVYINQLTRIKDYMNVVAKCLEKEKIINIDTVTIETCKEEFSLMKTLASKIDGISKMAPIFYLPYKDSAARKIAYAYVKTDTREIYRCKRDYDCIFDKRIIKDNYEHLHIYFRKHEILAVHCNDVERGKYFGVSVPRYLSSLHADEWEFKRNNKVESVAMDLKVGIYDVRFERFFNIMFDFYITSGIDW